MLKSHLCVSLQVMEHPHTLLLGKVLQANIALRNAHMKNSERSKIIICWMDLQQSINVLFDSKTANSESIPLFLALMGVSSFSDDVHLSV